MIPLALVTGFLGSGKTTLLQRVLDRYRDRRLVFLVNECANVDVDGRRLDLPADRLVSIPGGSIFCRCLSGQFLQALQRVANDIDPAPDGLIIEASGIADPRVITQMLAETRLDQTYALRHIVAVVDPGSFLKLIHTLPNIIAQVEACHVALINKTDVYDEETLRSAEQEVRRINPDASVICVEHADVDLDLLAAPAPRELMGQWAECADPNYVTVTVPVAQSVDEEIFKAGLSAIRDEVYRVKGFVRVVREQTPATAPELHDVDLSPAGLALTPLPDDDRAAELVIIARSDELQATAAFVRQLSR